MFGFISQKHGVANLVLISALGCGLLLVQAGCPEGDGGTDATAPQVETGMPQKNQQHQLSDDLIRACSKRISLSDNEISGLVNSRWQGALYRDDWSRQVEMSLKFSSVSEAQAVLSLTNLPGYAMSKSGTLSNKELVLTTSEGASPDTESFDVALCEEEQWLRLASVGKDPGRVFYLKRIVGGV